jgi:hypothetical protein
VAKGKYADIVDKLPRDWGTDPAFQDKVNAVKRTILEGDPEKEGLAELSSDAIEEIILEITSLQQVLNDHLIRKIGARTANRLASLYADVRKMKDSFDKQEKTTNVIVDAYEQLLVEQYEAETTRSLELDGVGVVRVQYEPAAKIVDKAANRKWAVDNGMEQDLSLPWPTVNALTKALLLQGEDAPGGVEAVSRPKVVFTKEK